MGIHESNWEMGSSSSTPPQPAPPAPLKCPLITEDEIKQLRQLHAHVHVAGVDVQKRAACLLANLAENDQNQETIVSEGGLQLLIPLMQSPEQEVQRLAVHSLANLSVNEKNRDRIVDEGALPPLVALL